MNCVANYLNSDFCRDERPAITFFKGLKSLDDPHKNITFNQLTKNVSKAQKELKRLGLKRGDTILIFEAPSPDMYAMIIAMLASGVKLLLVEPWMPLSNIEKILRDVKPQAFMTGLIGRAWAMRSKELRQIKKKFNSSALHNHSEGKIVVEDMKEEEEAVLTFTSGTSGNPKGVHRKHQYLVDQAEVLKKHLHYDENQGMDLTIFTNVTLLNLGMGKGSLLIPGSWRPSTLSQLDRLPPEFRPDTLAAGPGFLKTLMKHAKVESLRSLHLGGALADTKIYERAFGAWPKANFTHVYGSSEAEPVSLSDLKVAVQKSKDAGLFQTLFLGNPIDDVQLTERAGTLWVHGPHVSPEYQGDIMANKMNKFKDEDGKLWHNMGDRIEIKDDGLWYRGRDFQQLKDFQQEQSIYCKLGHSKCFIHRTGSGKKVLVGELSNHDLSVCSEFEFNSFLKARIIRDKRHKARIDRNKTLKKAGHAIN